QPSRRWLRRRVADLLTHSLFDTEIHRGSQGCTDGCATDGEPAGWARAHADSNKSRTMVRAVRRTPFHTFFSVISRTRYRGILASRGSEKRGSGGAVSMAHFRANRDAQKMPSTHRESRGCARKPGAVADDKPRAGGLPEQSPIGEEHEEYG